MLGVVPDNNPVSVKTTQLGKSIDWNTQLLGDTIICWINSVLDDKLIFKLEIIPGGEASIFSGVYILILLRVGGESNS